MIQASSFALLHFILLSKSSTSSFRGTEFSDILTRHETDIENDDIFGTYSLESLFNDHTDKAAKNKPSSSHSVTFSSLASSIINAEQHLSSLSRPTISIAFQKYKKLLKNVIDTKEGAKLASFMSNFDYNVELKSSESNNVMRHEFGRYGTKFDLSSVQYTADILGRKLQLAKGSKDTALVQKTTVFIARLHLLLSDFKSQINNQSHRQGLADSEYIKTLCEDIDNILAKCNNLFTEVYGKDTSIVRFQELKKLKSFEIAATPLPSYAKTMTWSFKNAQRFKK